MSNQVHSLEQSSTAEELRVRADLSSDALLLALLSEDQAIHTRRLLVSEAHRDDLLDVGQEILGSIHSLVDAHAINAVHG